ncbi:SNF2 family N-terminal domain-containing protein [Chytridium lagenaria]|nr:SNF2 family N-terminal domain-containing protein [Chytridium lagenaria]
MKRRRRMVVSDSEDDASPRDGQSIRTKRRKKASVETTADAKGKGPAVADEDPPHRLIFCGLVSILKAMPLASVPIQDALDNVPVVFVKETIKTGRNKKDMTQRLSLVAQQADGLEPVFSFLMDTSNRDNNPILHALYDAWKLKLVQLTAALYPYSMGMEDDARGQTEEDAWNMDQVWLHGGMAPVSVPGFLLRISIHHRVVDGSQDIHNTTSSKTMHRLLDLLYPSKARMSQTDLVKRIMSGCVPDSYPVHGSTLQPLELLPTLHPFQARAVSWMLEREGVILGPSGNAMAKTPPPPMDPPFFCTQIRPTSGDPFYLNRLTGLCSTTAVDLQCDNEDELKGGVLADEMGLGKTIEILALVLLHRQSLVSNPMTTPDVLKKTFRPKESNGELMCIICQSCGTTFDRKNPMKLICKDCNLFAHPTCHTASPDTQCFVCCEPADSSSRSGPLSPAPSESTETTASSDLISSPATLIITPLSIMSQWVAEISTHAPSLRCYCYQGQKGVAETINPLIFLNYDIVITSYDVLRTEIHMAKDDNKRSRRAPLSAVLARIMHRNTKVMAEKDLRLPPQLQGYLGLELSAVERRYYDDLFEQCRNEVRTLVGGGGKDDEKNGFKMRSWLLQLRQTCCHPQVGERNKKMLGGNLKSIDEVLNLMHSQCESSIGSSERQIVLLKIQRAQTFELEKNFASALSVYSTCLGTVRRFLQIATAAASNLTDDDIPETMDHDTTSEEGDDLPKRRKSTQSRRLRMARTRTPSGVFHRLLSSFPETICGRGKTSGVGQIEGWGDEGGKGAGKGGGPDTCWRDFVEIDFGGCGEIAKMFGEAVEGVIKVWREKIVEYLLMSLEEEVVAEDANSPTGEKSAEAKKDSYAKNLDFQSELDIYLDAYADAVVDRRQLLTGVSFFKPKRAIDSDLFKSLQKQRTEHLPPGGSEVHVGLFIKQLKTKIENASIFFEKQLMANSVVMVTKCVELEVEALEIFQGELVFFRRLANARIEYFRHLQRISDGVTPPEPLSIPPQQARIQMEHEESQLSDHLVLQRRRQAYLFHLMKEQNQEEAEAVRECVICRSEFGHGFMTFCGHLYCAECTKFWVLKHHKCAVCNQKVSRNQVVSVSFRLYDKTKTRTLPPSNPDLTVDVIPSKTDQDAPLDFQSALVTTLSAIPITGSFGTKIDTIVRHLLYLRQTDPGCKSLVFSQWEQVLYILSAALQANHIRFVRMEGGKRGSDAVQKFREDAGLEVFMLHAKNQSAGLTLVQATHVFMVEPVLNTGLEMQAIGRVHRIGQTKRTWVYRYVVLETVEERIVGVVRRRERVGKGDVAGLVWCDEEGDVVDLEEGSLMKGKKRLPVYEKRELGGGEMVRERDLMWCLFGENGLQDWRVERMKGWRMGWGGCGEFMDVDEEIPHAPVAREAAEDGEEPSNRSTVGAARLVQEKHKGE